MVASLWRAETPLAVKRGDIWQLGSHKLMCGNSTNAEDVARLFGDERYSLCFTSPPYSAQRTYKIGSFDWHSLMCGAFSEMIAHGQPDCHILINLGLSHKNRQVDMYWLPWLMQCASIGWPLFGWYVWDKLNGLPGENQGRLMPAHEFIFHFNRQPKEACKWVPTIPIAPRINKKGLRRPDGVVRTDTHPDKYGGAYKVPDSVIRINRECARGIHTANHPAVFPVALPEFIMQSYSQEGDIVYEPFCGSGTSLIAGTNLNRRVYAMEVEPSYCELAIERWEDKTCQQAEKER